MDGRPDPEQILKKNFPKGSGNGHGRLKIFFGYAAGVGKTYAMLEAARDEAAAGRDVLAGYIEPHDRPETMALLLSLIHISRATAAFISPSRTGKRPTA